MYSLITSLQQMAYYTCVLYILKKKLSQNNLYIRDFLQEEGDLLCLPGGSDTQGQHGDEGRGERTERDNHRKVCTTDGV